MAVDTGLRSKEVFSSNRVRKSSYYDSLMARLYLGSSQRSLRISNDSWARASCCWASRFCLCSSTEGCHTIDSSRSLLRKTGQTDCFFRGLRLPPGRSWDGQTVGDCECVAGHYVVSSICRTPLNPLYVKKTTTFTTVRRIRVPRRRGVNMAE